MISEITRLKLKPHLPGNEVYFDLEPIHFERKSIELQNEFLEIQYNYVRFDYEEGETFLYFTEVASLIMKNFYDKIRKEQQIKKEISIKDISKLVNRVFPVLNGG